VLNAKPNNLFTELILILHQVFHNFISQFSNISHPLPKKAGPAARFFIVHSHFYQSSLEMLACWAKRLKRFAVLIRIGHSFTYFSIRILYPSKYYNFKKIINYAYQFI